MGPAACFPNERHAFPLWLIRDVWLNAARWQEIQYYIINQRLATNLR